MTSTKCIPLLALLATIPLSAFPQAEAPVASVTAEVESKALSDPAAPFRTLKLSGRGVSAEGKTFKAGAGTYSFTSGRFSEIVSDSGAPTGYFFSGAGQLVWAADEPAGVELYGKNAKRVGGFDPRPEGVGKAFTEAVFLFSKAATPGLGELSEGAATSSSRCSATTTSSPMRRRSRPPARAASTSPVSSASTRGTSPTA